MICRLATQLHSTLDLVNSTAVKLEAAIPNFNAAGINDRAQDIKTIDCSTPKLQTTLWSQSPVLLHLLPNETMDQRLKLIRDCLTGDSSHLTKNASCYALLMNTASGKQSVLEYGW